MIKDYICIEVLLAFHPAEVSCKLNPLAYDNLLITGQRTGFGSSFGSSFSDRTFFRGGQGEDEQEDDTTVTPPPEIDPEAGLGEFKLDMVTQFVYQLYHPPMTNQ